jgi:hypothetical protein
MPAFGNPGDKHLFKASGEEPVFFPDDGIKGATVVPGVHFLLVWRTDDGFLWRVLLEPEKTNCWVDA